jgi:hypothetical protein
MEGSTQFLRVVLECVSLVLRFDDAVENMCARHIQLPCLITQIMELNNVGYETRIAIFMKVC